MVIDFLKRKLTDRFIRNIGWLGLSEVCMRLVRLATTVVLARWLTSEDYGLAAIVMTTNEFVMVFTRGIWEKLIQADEEDLEIFCQTTYWLSWMICGSLFVIQCLAAFGIAWFYHDQSVILPIWCIALVYLMIPFAAIQATLIQRENRLHITAMTNGIQISVDNLLAIILALLGFGMWAIVLPKVVVAPIWVGIHYFNHSWRPSGRFTLTRWQEIFQFSRNILGIEFLKTYRQNVDYLIAGRFLGLEALGLYYFAFNAGLGISLSIIGSIDSALFPHLSDARSDRNLFRERYLSSLKTIAIIIAPIILLQASLAPFYVPIVFGQKWIPAIPVLMVICLSAIPRPFANATAFGLWILDKSHWDLKWNIFFSILFTIALLLGVQWGVLGVAFAVLLSHGIALPLYGFWGNRYILATTR